MKRFAISLALALMAATTVTTVAHAQFEDQDGVPPPPFRKGLWMSLFGGYGSQGCSACTGRIEGATGTLTIGGSLSEQFLVGAGVGGWTTEAEDGTRLSIAMGDFRFRIYPSAYSKWFITFGAGLSTVSDGVFPGFTGEWGTSFMLGTGFDVRVSSGLSLTPYVGLLGAKTENLDANILQAGLAITIH